MKAILSFFFVLLLSLPCYATSLSIFGGQDVSNSLNDSKSTAWQLEGDFLSHRPVSVAIGYINEGHHPGRKRDGIYTGLLFHKNVTRNFELGFLVGPYVSSTTKTVNENQTVSTNTYSSDGGRQSTTVTTTIHRSYKDVYHTNLLIAFRAIYRLSYGLSGAIEWERVTTFRSTDADLFMVGIQEGF